MSLATGGRKGQPGDGVARRSVAETSAPSASNLAARLAVRRADWLPRYFPAGKLRANVFELGSADGDAGRSFPIPLAGQSRLIDFAGGFAGDDLALLGRAIGAGDDMTKAYREAAAFLGIGGTTAAPRVERSSPPKTETPLINNEHAQELWREAAPLCDCQPGAVYLRSRGIYRWPETVYFHPACYFGEGRSTAPAILVPVNDPATGLVRAIWRIKLDGQGGKLWRGGYGSCPGGASRLFDHWDGHIGVAEGAEDALALHLLTGLPTWAGLSATGMAGMILPDRVRRVTIAQDNDPPDRRGRRPGPEAAQRLARRLQAEGREVRIIASDFGKDANDLLLRRRVA